jgi:hypothetical protein
VEARRLPIESNHTVNDFIVNPQNLRINP